MTQTIDLTAFRPTDDPTADRVRNHTAPEVQDRIDAGTRDRLAVARTWSRQEIDARLDELQREWDVERVLEANASTLVVLGSLLAVRRGRRWLLLPLVVGSFLLQHAVQGWCPPLAVIRRLGVRTRREIEAERWALKSIRGDIER